MVVVVAVVRKTTAKNAREQRNEALQGGNHDVEISRPTIFYDLVLKKLKKQQQQKLAQEPRLCFSLNICHSKRA